jgi:DNA-binding transcriptional LysR family regulator
VLKRFADTHPAVEVAVTCAPSSEIVGKLKAGELDLALISEGHEPQHWPAVELWRGPMHWITSERYAPHRIDPLPLALAAGDCSWRVMTLKALERAGRRYRVAYTSATHAGTHAPVLAGLAVTTSPVTWLPEGLRALPMGELPDLPDTAILLLTAPGAQGCVAQVLATHIADTFRNEMRSSQKAAA